MCSWRSLLERRANQRYRAGLHADVGDQERCFRVGARGDQRGSFRLESLRDRRPIPVVPPEMSAILPSNLFIRDLLYA